MTTAACPLCQRPFPAGSADLMASGNSFVCARCEVRWDAARLETVAAYGRYVAERAALDLAAPSGQWRRT